VGNFKCRLTASAGFAGGQRLLPACFAVQAVVFLYFARWRRAVARTAGVGAAEA
jgi:hypothetical protein